MCCTTLEEQTMSGIVLWVTFIVILILDAVAVTICKNDDSFFWSILAILSGFITVLVSFVVGEEFIIYGLFFGGPTIIIGCIKLPEVVKSNQKTREAEEKILKQKNEEEINSINEEISKKRSLINKLKKKQKKVLLQYDEQCRNDFVNVNNNQIDG